MNEERLQEQAELYALIQNDTRRRLLKFIYQESRSYKDLIEFSNLKPGSLYHHLKVMDKLVDKLDHGLYGITEQGKWILHELDMVADTKPQVTQHQPEVSEVLESQRESITSQKILAPNQSTDMLNHLLWIGTPNIVLIAAIVLINILMAFQGVTIAGIAIYTAPLAGLFSILAFGIGLVVLYYIEQLVFSLEVHRSLQYAVIIRIVGMLPASLIAFTMYILFLVGLTPGTTGWMLLFVVSSVLGYLVMTLGLQFLQGIEKGQASLLAALPSAVDLLIGFTILLVIT